MRQSSTNDSGGKKRLARAQYTKRQIDKFIKWSLKQKGCLRYKDLLSLYEQYDIKVY